MKPYKITFNYFIHTIRDDEFDGWLIPFNQLMPFEKEGVFYKVNRIHLATKNDRVIELDVEMPYRARSNNEAVHKAFGMLDILGFRELAKEFLITDIVNGKTFSPMLNYK